LYTYYQIMPRTRRSVRSPYCLHLCSATIMKGKKKSGKSKDPSLEPKDRTAWPKSDETALITYIVANQAKAGDNMNFDPTFWGNAATEMAKFTSQGGAKTADTCRAKWTRVRTDFDL
jgi:hypothetical protein